MSDISPTQIILTHEEQDSFRVLAKELERYDPVRDTEEYIVAAQLHSARLPERIRRAALNFRRNGDAAGGMLLRNLPVDPVPPTPDHAADALAVAICHGGGEGRREAVARSGAAAALAAGIPVHDSSRPRFTARVPG